MRQPELNKRILIQNLIINYYYWPSDDPKNPAVIFLHGWRLNGQVWLPIINYLTELNFNIYSLDLPGFGHSTVPPSDFTLQDYVAVVKEFIEKLKLRNVIIVGHSFGGRLALKLAAVNHNLVKKMVLVNSAGLRQRNKVFLLTLKKNIAKILKPLFRLPFLRVLRIEIYKLLGAEDYVTVPDVLKQIFINIINEDLTPLLSSIKTPTLIIWGEDDKVTPLAIARILNEKITGSKLVILPSAGHLSFFDQPLLFVEQLIEFLQTK